MIIAGSQMDEETLFELRALEESLWRAETRFDDHLMESTFAPDFFEFGRSGRTYTRKEMMFGDSGFGEIKAKLPLQNFQARYLTEEVVQVTYVSEVTYEGVTQFGNRSSIWSRIDGKWRLRFHQGTPTEIGPVANEQFRLKSAVGNRTTERPE